MTGKDILDRCSNIIHRQDLDRTQLLFFINTTRRTIFRNYHNFKFDQYRKNVTCTNGLISLTDLKTPRVVEYQDTSIIQLKRVPTYERVLELTPTLESIGNPAYYYINGTNVQILPAPTTGQINIMGEFWPADLTDSTDCTDITTVEIPEILIYLGTAEYIDMLGEDGSKWREKASSMFSEYLKDLKRQQTEGINLMERDPLGNLQTSHRNTYEIPYTERIDGGTF